MTVLRDSTGAPLLAAADEDEDEDAVLVLALEAAVDDLASVSRRLSSLVACLRRRRKHCCRRPLAKAAPSDASNGAR